MKLNGCRTGWRQETAEAAVVIGTRSAIWTPLKSPGIYIVDEEHDPSYKQEGGFRYSAKDIAVVRGKFDRAPVVLGSATPSLETIQNIRSRKYSRLRLPARASGASSPEIRFINLRNEPVSGAIAKTLLAEIAVTLEKNNQVSVVFEPERLCAGHSLPQLRLVRRMQALQCQDDLS